MLHVRAMNYYDIDDVYIIANESFFVSSTRDNIVKELLEDNCKFFVIENNDKVVGFYEAIFVLDESELNTIAVKKEYRNKSIASTLMNHYVDICKEKNIKKIYLEVSTKNIYAIKLYEKFNFIVNGFRKNYYKEINEDAYRMVKEVI